MHTKAIETNRRQILSKELLIRASIYSSVHIFCRKHLFANDPKASYMLEPLRPISYVFYFTKPVSLKEDQPLRFLSSVLFNY